MSGQRGKPQPPDARRTRAEPEFSENTPVDDVENHSSDQIRGLVYELELHKIDLGAQNDQLREAQRDSKASRERFLQLYDSAPTGYLSLDLAGSIVEANLSITRMLKTPRSELIGKRLSAFVTPHCQDRWHLAQRDLAAGVERSDFTLSIVPAEGATVDAQVVGVLAKARDHEPRKIHLTLIDMTELHRTERALESALAAATLAEERERRKLAADLHDDAGQLLSLASMKLQALGDADETQRGDQMIELESLLIEIRSRVSSLSFRLSPPLLHDVNLLAALQWLKDDLETTYGLHVTIIKEHELELDENVRVTLYRATRELLLNVVKHAGVKLARVRIARDGGMARITVEDTGVGMPPRAKRYGFGLLALRGRVELLGGSLDIRGSEGMGTTVVVSLPFRLLEDEGER